MLVLETNIFKKSVKKLHSNQKQSLDDAIREILSNPLIGIAKVGDLSGVRVYKFYMNNQLTLVAYSYNEYEPSINLLAFGSHENFYRDLK